MTDRKKLRISEASLNGINSFLMDEDNPLVADLLEVIEKHGGVAEINKKAEEARTLENLVAQLESKKSPYVKRMMLSFRFLITDEAFLVLRLT